MTPSDPTNPISNAIETAVLRQRLESLEHRLNHIDQSVGEIKNLVAEIKGGYKVTSTLVMIFGTILGFIGSVLVKGLFK